MDKRFTILILATLVAGCSAAWYRDSADLQVNQLVRDREKSTLDYTPQVEVGKEIPTTLPRQAYAKIPTSPIPPPTTSPMERAIEVDVPTSPLGPELRWKTAPPLEGQDVGVVQPSRSRIEGVFGPPTPADFYRRYDLFGVLEYAVQHSRAYRDQMDALYLAALEVTLERHLLSPRPFVTQSVNFTGGQGDVDYRSAMTATTSAGVRQKLPYGGEVVAKTLVSFVDALNDRATSGESASLVLSGSVPLLRGAGMINLEALINSERQLVYQVRAFEDYRRSFVVTIASQYFLLLAQQQGVVNRRLNLVNLALLTERTQALYDAGRLSFLEVQRALQSRLSAEDALNSAEADYQSALDNFKLILGMPLNQRLDVVPVELDVPVPRALPDEAVELATLYRLDLRTAFDQIEDAQRGVKNAENLLLPQLDATAQASVGNEPGSPASALNARTATYSAGLTLDLPIDRVAERNAFRRSLINFQKAQRNFAQLRDRIATEVRDSLRSIRAADVSLQIQRRGIDLAQRRLEFSNELLRQGKVNARDVVESQTSLLDAQDRFEQARSQLQIRILEYLRETGTLRVDPKAGAIGRAMDRAALQAAGFRPE